MPHRQLDFYVLIGDDGHYLGSTGKMTTRGIRNNNPGNLEPGGYQGETGTDGRFAVFDTMENGIRALALNLLAYQDKHGIDSVGSYIDENNVVHQGAVNRWAPNNENNTQAYIAFVCTVLGCKPEDKFNFHDASFLFWMVTGIGEEENGHDAFISGVTDAQITAGVQAALSH